MTVSGVIPINRKRTPINTRPGIVWKIDIIGRMTKDHLGIRENKIPSKSPIMNPNNTETRT